LDLAEETDLLRKIPMFAKMETSKLKLLAFASEIVSFDTGDTVFQSGESADYAYVIMSGSVDIVTETDSGPVLVATLTMKITGDMFFRILRENSEVALDVIRMLSDKLSRTHAQLEALQKQVNKQGGS
jgi:CRP-like cAMP-binding protein